MKPPAPRPYPYKARWLIAGGIFAVLLVGWWFCLPRPLFDRPYTRVLLDERGRLLAAARAADGQYRFSPPDSVPARLAAAVLLYEDRHFYRHPGINPVAVGLSLLINLRQGRVVQGGSTISQQVMRLAAGNPPRTLWAKAKEAAQALRLEAGYSKEEILRLYVGHAPYGGNVVGVEAACWRYFGHGAGALTWAQAAMLAVLPKAPGMLHPGRSRARLQARRDGLLRRLATAGSISGEVLAQSLAEPLPGRPKALPMLAPHLLGLAGGQTQGAIRTSLSARLQESTGALLVRLQSQIAGSYGAGNLACIVADSRSGRILAYHGNICSRAQGAAASPWVDAAQAPRSTGSLLKPFLLAQALDAGLAMPSGWLEDVPRLYGGFAPKNFYDDYEGLVPADLALGRSLNLPFVGLQHSLGTGRFLDGLRRAGLSGLDRSAQDYGLSLCLGGGEETLYRLTRLYCWAGQAYRGQALWFGWRRGDAEGANGYDGGTKTPELPSRAALAAVLTMLAQAERPELAAHWRAYAREQGIAFKTGTSQGFRDGWAIGVGPAYTVGVWVGNADGEGRPGLTGIDVAAPVMFSVLAALPARTGIVGTTMAVPGLIQRNVCTLTGWPAGPACPQPAGQELPAGCAKAALCPYHALVPVEPTTRARVSSDCYTLSQARTEPALVLPPLAGWYARKARALPAALPWLAGCRAPDAGRLRILYPAAGAVLQVPLLGGRPGQVALQATTAEAMPVHFCLDGRYLCQTVAGVRHQWLGSLVPGPHHLVCISPAGAVAERRFVVE